MTEKTDILSFPVQMYGPERPGWSMSLEEVFWDSRLHAASILNKLARGEIKELPEEVIEAIRTVNEVCREIGYPTIDCDL